MIAMFGAVLVAASQAQAQITYQNEDLLLNFRNTADTGWQDVTVDLGQISAFSALTGVTVLDASNGTNNSYTPLFTESELITAFGATLLTNVGFTAVAVDNISDTAWVTRVQATGTMPPQYSSAQPVSANAITVADQVGAIGRGASGFDGTIVTAFGTDGVIVGSGQAYSYQSLAAPAEQPSVINFLGENTAGLAGGLLESVTGGSNTVYSALWKVPVSGTGSDTYLGYFTFNGITGELDYTAGVPVPLLSVSKAGANVVVSWPNTATFTLQTNGNLAVPSGWAACSYSITTTSGTPWGTNSVTIPPTGSLFFRLVNP